MHQSIVSLITGIILFVSTSLTANAALTGASVKHIEASTVINRSDINENRFVTLSGDMGVEGETVGLYWHSYRPGTETAPEALAHDRVALILRGSLKRLTEKGSAPMREGDLVYDEAGTTAGFEAADNTAEVLEFRWITPKNGSDATESKPMFPAGRVINRNYMQWCMPHDRKTLVKVIQGRRGQAVIARLEPECDNTPVFGPEESILLVLRGNATFIIDGKTIEAGENDVVRIGKGSSASVTTGEKGATVAAVISPSRPSLTSALSQRISLFHSLFPPFVQPEPVTDGRYGDPILGFTEGPNWQNGRFYFTDQSYGGLRRIEADGSHTMLYKDINPCGTAILPNGNFAVCDLEHKRIVEITPEGRFIGTLTDSYKGAPYPGNPNDIVCDNRGGLYYTIMSFARPEGSNVVFYRAPDGTVTRATEPGDIGILNGCCLSPEGSVLYANDDMSTFIRAYDVAPDGSLSNGRPFAEIIRHETVLGGSRSKSFADGMICDREGNLFVCASGYVQIFSSGGIYRGGFMFPKPAFHLAFGGTDLSTLYVCTINRVYKVKTNTKGFMQVGMNPFSRPIFKPSQKVFNEIFPAPETAAIAVNGSEDGSAIRFTEGPTWLGDTLFFSDQPGGFHALRKDGSWKLINHDGWTCGTAPFGNGNLAACYVVKPSIVEMSRDGRMISTIFDTIDGEPFYGNPNDIEADMRGGLYVTITPFFGKDAVKTTGLVYRSPDGSVRDVIEHNSFGFPNGMALAPDGSRLYLSDSTSTTVWAFDIGSDGSLSNRHPFATIGLVPEKQGKTNVSSAADGMTCDSDGNLYVTCEAGLHVFDRTGKQLGVITFPESTSNCTFGGYNLSTLYVTCRKLIWAIDTGVRGITLQ